MGERHKNFKDPMLSSQDIWKRKYETPPFFLTPFNSKIKNVVSEDNINEKLRNVIQGRHVFTWYK